MIHTDYSGQDFRWGYFDWDRPFVCVNRQNKLFLVLPSTARKKEDGYVDYRVTTYIDMENGDARTLLQSPESVCSSMFWTPLEGRPVITVKKPG